MMDFLVFLAKLYAGWCIVAAIAVCVLSTLPWPTDTASLRLDEEG